MPPRISASGSGRSRGPRNPVPRIDINRFWTGQRCRARLGPARGPAGRSSVLRREPFSRTALTLLLFDLATTSLLLPPPNRLCPPLLLDRRDRSEYIKRHAHFPRSPIILSHRFDPAANKLNVQLNVSRM